MRSAEPQRDAEALARADRDVSAPLPRRTQQRQRQEVCCGDHVGADRVRLCRERSMIAHSAAGAGILDENAEAVVVRQSVAEISHDDLDAHRKRARVHDRFRLWQHVGVDIETAAGRRGVAAAQRHRFGGGRGLVEQRGTRDRKSGEIGDHRLEVEQRLEPALRDFGLVGRVRGVPGRVLQNVAADHRRRVRAVIAEPDHRCRDGVHRRDRAQFLGDLDLGRRGRYQRTTRWIVEDRGRYRAGHQIG